MDGLNISKILASLRNPEIYLRKIKQDGSFQEGLNPAVNQNSDTQQAQQTNNTTYSLWGKNTVNQNQPNNNQAQNVSNNQNNVQNNNITQNNQNQIINNTINNQQAQNSAILQNNNQVINPAQNNIMPNAQPQINPENPAVANNIVNQTASQGLNQGLNQVVGQEINKPKIINEGNKSISNNNYVNNSLGDDKTGSNFNKTFSTNQVSNQIPANQLASMDRSVYVKNLLGLPQTLGELLFAIQNKAMPITFDTLSIHNLNQELLKNQKMISQIFDENVGVPNALQDIATQMQQNIQSTQKDAIALFYSGMISMSSVSEAILKNSKSAVANLVIAMASTAKSSTEIEQIRKTLSVINSCVSMAESNNSAQTLKSLMLLYLPWLPLHDDVGFDLEVDTTPGEYESVESKLTVLIQTRHYGNVKGVFTLTTSNSVDVYIICSDDFPKNTLQKSLAEESTSHAMNTNIEVEAVAPIRREENENQEAKVNLSATNEMNPYLLLMAHAFIRNTIFIDSNSYMEKAADIAE